MDYYLFRNDVDTEETGEAYPQVVFNNPKKINPNPVLSANKVFEGEYPPKKLVFDYLELNDGANFTDLMSSSLHGNGFVMSDKLKTIFEESNLKDYRFYKIKLFEGEKEIKGYWYFHSASNLRDFIDYKKSTFYIGDIIGEPIRDLGFTPNSFTELELFQKTLPYAEESVWPKQIFLKHTFPFNLDLFKLNAYNYDFFVSKRLVDKMKKYNVTGVYLREIRNFIKAPALA
ncbi:MAG: hypothetical protein K0S32_4002 [Bacteroidetes bacterium]|jgi:hypothetical protein|nr:hypothetical protein [Bacteroidota bacterium]